MKFLYVVYLKSSQVSRQKSSNERIQITAKHFKIILPPLRLLSALFYFAQLGSVLLSSDIPSKFGTTLTLTPREGEATLICDISLPTPHRCARTGDPPLCSSYSNHLLSVLWQFRQEYCELPRESFCLLYFVVFRCAMCKCRAASSCYGFKAFFSFCCRCWCFVLMLLFFLYWNACCSPLIFYKLADVQMTMYSYIHM